MVHSPTANESLPSTDYGCLIKRKHRHRIRRPTGDSSSNQSPPPLYEHLPEFPSLGENMVRVIPESVLSYGELSLLLVQLTISEESMTTCLLALRSTRLENDIGITLKGEYSGRVLFNVHLRLFIGGSLIRSLKDKDATALSKNGIDASRWDSQC